MLGRLGIYHFFSPLLMFRILLVKQRESMAPTGETCSSNPPRNTISGNACPFMPLFASIVSISTTYPDYILRNGTRTCVDGLNLRWSLVIRVLSAQGKFLERHLYTTNATGSSRKLPHIIWPPGNRVHRSAGWRFALPHKWELSRLRDPQVLGRRIIWGD